MKSTGVVAKSANVAVPSSVTGATSSCWNEIMVGVIVGTAGVSVGVGVGVGVDIMVGSGIIESAGESIRA